jgi:hypothetical protein
LPMFSEGVTSWDETGQFCYWRIYPMFLFENLGVCWFLFQPQVTGRYVNSNTLFPDGARTFESLAL